MISPFSSGSCPPLREDERGAYLTVVVSLVVVSLAFAGLVIDLGLLYRTSVTLQKAADAGVLAGLGFRARVGWTAVHGQNPIRLGEAGLNDGEVADVVRTSIIANLAAAGIEVAPGLVDVQFSSLTDQVAAQVSFDQPVFLMGSIPGQQACGTGNRCRVSVSATAELVRANIGMVLDTSGSMRCPPLAEADSNNPNSACPCLTAAPPNDCDTLFFGSQRIDLLKAAAAEFASHFNPNRDRINIVPYNIAADPDFFSISDGNGSALPFGSDSQRFAAFRDTIQRLIPQANTNHCDGLLTSFADMAQVTAPRPIFGREQSFFLLFTDGAPTAGNFSYSRRTGLEVAVTANGGRNEWIHYTIEWSLDNPAEASYSGPSPFVARGDMPFNFNFLDSATGQPAAVPPGAVSCGEVVAEEERFSEATSACVQNLEFITPGGRTVAAIRPWSAGEDINDYIQQFYHCTIEIADDIRASGGYVFAVGLGPEAFVGSNDPYQDMNDINKRKDIFLRRVAFDRFSARDPQFGSSDPPFGPRRTVPVNDPTDARGTGTSIRVGYDEYRDFEDPAFDTAGREHLDGAYFGTEDAQELSGLFVRIAKEILIRLVP